MASSESTAALNNSESPNASHSPSRKRPINGITELHSPKQPANGFIRTHSSDGEIMDTPASSTPETSRRKRKKTRAFEVPGPTFARRISTGAMGVSGRGVKLSTIPNIVYAMEKRHAKTPEIEFLHRLLFNSAGTVLKRKSNIRAFSGFIFQSEKERSRVRDKLMRCHFNLLKRVAALLDVQIKHRKEAKDDAPREDAEIELAAEAFLGSDSLASEDVKNDLRSGGVLVDHMPAEKVVESSVLRITNGKLENPGTASTSILAKGTGNGMGGLAGSKDDHDRTKAEGFMSRQKKEESARIGREETVQAILAFLEMPMVPEGRASLAQIEKEKKRQKKALEKAKAQKALLKKAEEKRKQLLAKSKARESDEDGDEDLEIEAKPWIVLARERQERQKRIGDSEMGADIAANGHS